MISISYSPTFVRQFGRCESELKLEIKEKIELLTNRVNHQRLRVHKLHGRLKNYYGFSINYKLRIVFTWINREEIYLLALGDHEIYRN